MRRPVVRLLAVLYFALAVPVVAQTLPDLFQKAKAQVKSQSWDEALATLDQLDAESGKPGNEAARRQLVAPVAFYRGVCEASLDRPEKAQADFASFLQEQPNAAIDRTIYSRKVVAAFEAAGRSADRDAREAPAPGAPTLAHRYDSFQAPPNADEKPDERWAEGPVKWIMTPGETAAWGLLKSEAERAAFVEKFWAARNPKPGLADNPARTELERRIAFADAYLQQDDKTRGALTDRGRVFILLGPPTRASRRVLIYDEDQSISEGTDLPEQSWMSNRNSIHIFGPHATDATNSFREVWHYRRESLPKAVSAYELYVTFVTKKGYGRAVLQRDAAVLSALEAAKEGSVPISTASQKVGGN